VGGRARCHGKPGDLHLIKQKYNFLKLINIEEKPYLKKNEVCLLSPNFKLASK
jgi:hypothetical protein